MIAYVSLMLFFVCLFVCTASYLHCVFFLISGFDSYSLRFLHGGWRFLSSHRI